MQLSSGTLLQGGKYKIEKVLGQGSFGITYLAEHTALGKKVCIKEFFMKELNSRGDDGSITGLSDGSLSYNYAQKFRKEAQNLASMEHPNIVRVTDCFDENATFYYVMEYIEGQDLNTYIKQHALSEAEAMAIIKDVANALIYMHDEKHMLHLDLKPGNVMRRNSDGHIFLIDFGLSKHYSNDGQPETSTTIGLGTAGYAPIEQADQAKNGEFRPTIDVYALGATLYKLLTRETPPPASELVTDDELISDKLKEYNVSDAISSVVVNAMLPNVRKRIQTIKSFVEILQNCKTSNITQSSIQEDDEETIIASSPNTPPNAKGKRENIYGTKSDYEKLSVSSTSSQSEETIAFSTNKMASHPDFDEVSYKVDSEYIKFPVVTGNKAKEGDFEAMLALGMMALRGEGVRQDFDTAHAWFLKLKNLGDDRGEKLIAQWSSLKAKYSTSSKETNETANTTESNYNGGNIIGWIVAIIMFVAIIIVCVQGCENKTKQAPDGNVYEDIVDTVAYSPAPITDQIEEIAPHKTKGGWRHSGTVITNYSEGSGLSVCKSKIDKNNACKNGCIVGSGKGVVIIGKNSFACEGVSDNIKSILEGYRSKGSRINDIAITPQGKYVIIEENNGYSNNTGIPELDKELSRANSARETIYSVSLTDGGKWAVITDAHYTSTGYFDVIETARKKYGEVHSVSMTDKAVVVCCNRGVYYKNVPKKLAKELDNLYWIPKYIKFCDGCTFLITDGKSAYWYYM